MLMQSGTSITDPFEVFTREELLERTSVKWTGDKLPLCIAEMDVALAEPVQHAVTHAITTGNTGYACNHAELIDAYRDIASARWGVNVDTTRAMANGGVLPAIIEILRATTAPGDNVIVTPPVYAPFYDFIAAAGRDTTDAPLTNDGRFDFEAIDRAMTTASAIVIANPHNPLGTHATREELEQLAALAEQHGVTVISDEIHSPITYQTQHIPYVTVDPRGYTVFSASKAFNLAALPASVMLAGPDASLENVSPTIMKSLSLIASTAHIAAMYEAHDWLDTTLQALDARRKHVTQLVTQNLPGVTYREPDSTYLAWLGFDFDDPAARIAAKGVRVQSGVPFGPGGERAVRLNFATRFDVLDEAIERIASVLVAGDDSVHSA